MSRVGYNGFNAEQIKKGSSAQSYALRVGKLPRQWVCSACSVQGSRMGDIIPHLEDYTNPVDGAIWLCSRCHLMVHLRFEYPDHWNAYREFIRDGGQLPLTRSGKTALRDSVNQPLAGYVNSSFTVLDDIESGVLLPERAKK